MSRVERRAQVGDWAYAWHEEGSYSGPFETREDALADAREVDCETDFWIAQVTVIPDLQSHVKAVMDSDFIAELAEENIADEYGTEDDVIEADWDALGPHIEKALEAWIKECDGRVCWFVVGKAEIVPVEDGNASKETPT